MDVARSRAVRPLDSLDFNKVVEVHAVIEKS